MGSNLGGRERGRAIKILVDSAPLVAAVDRRDSAHGFAARLLAGLRRKAVIPTAVLIEVDHIVTSRIGAHAARNFLKAVAGGTHEVAFLTSGLLRRAVELDRQYADLALGLADASVMAIAERHELPILTFDFKHFRATESAKGPWSLVVDEAAYRRHCEAS